MKSIKVLLYSISIVICSIQGCNHERNDQELNIQQSPIKIEIPEKKDNHITLDSLIKNVEIIFLETIQESLIGNIDKLIAQSGRYYLHDLRNQTLHVFDENGKFIFKLQRSGRGPGEFHELRDFQVDSSGYIYILTYRKIMKYSPDGEFENEFKFNFINAKEGLHINPTNFIRLNDGTFYLWGGSLGIKNNSDGLNYALCRINAKMKILEKHIPVERKIMGGLRFFKSYKGFNLRPLDDGNTIFSVGEKGLTPAYLIDFGKNKLPDNYFPNSFEDDFGIKRHNLLETKYCYAINRIQETKNFLYFTFTYNAKLTTLLYSKESQNSLCGQLDHVFSCLPFSFYIFNGISADDLICIVDPFLLADMRGDPTQICFPVQQIKDSFLKDLAKLKDTDNPVLFKMTLKGF